MKTSPAAKALSEAMHNNDIVSFQEIVKITEACDQGLKRCHKPEDIADMYIKNKHILDACDHLQGTDKRIQPHLHEYRQRSSSYLQARIAALTGDFKMPDSVRFTLNELMLDAVNHCKRYRAKEITYSDVQGDKNTAVSFTFNIERKDRSKVVESIQEQGFAIKYNDNWVVSPMEITTEDIDTAKKALVDYFKAIHENDYEPKMIDGMVKHIVPQYVHFPIDGSDPLGLADAFPIVFYFSNPVGHKFGLMAGYNPETKEVVPVEYM